MTIQTCSSCGYHEFEPGWIGDGATMIGLWISGPLQRHLLGAPKLGGRQIAIQASRCLTCGRLELFAPAD